MTDLTEYSPEELDDDKPADWPWRPDAILRDPYPMAGGLECVGEIYEVLGRNGEDQDDA